MKGGEMGVYDEYLTRAHWGPSEPLHIWVTRRLLLEFTRKAAILPDATHLLEIGSGTGRAGELARQMGFASYTGAEPTRALAEFCREQRGLTIIEEALPNLRSLPDSTFGAVFSMHVLEHATSYIEARTWCSEMARVVSPGGAILVAAPDVRDYGQNFWDADWSHGYPTTPQRVAQVLRDLGLCVEFEGSMHLGRVSGISAVLAHLISALLPTRLGDLVTRRVVGRPLASGFKIATLWGLVFVVARRPNDS